jgi:hypothetical protein
VISDGPDRGEHVREQEGEDELRDAVQHRARDTEQVTDPGRALHRREHPGGDTDDEADQDAGQHQDDRPRCRGGDDMRDRDALVGD